MIRLELDLEVWIFIWYDFLSLLGAGKKILGTCAISTKSAGILSIFFFAPWFLHGGLLLIICFIGSPHIGHTRNGVQPFIKQHRNHIRSLANYRIYYNHNLKSPNLSLFKSFKLIYLVTDVFLHYSEHYFIYTEC